MPKIGFSENDYMTKNFCLEVVELDSVALGTFQIEAELVIVPTNQQPSLK